MKETLLQILLLSLFYAAQGQDPGEELLSWSATRKLNWSDYKAKPDPNSDASATTRTYLAIDYHISTEHFNYTIRSSFSRSYSWGRDKTDYILSHEQGHFDIAEIFARKLHKRMSEYQFNKRTYQQELKRIYNEVADEKSTMQEQYDQETRHSIDKDKQAEWLKKISILLEELKDYANY